jgi:hypothetical protein
METPSHYACRVRLDGDAVFVVWSSAERDGFLRDPGGRLVVAHTPTALAGAAHALGAMLEDAGPAEYDFDRILAWCAAPTAGGVDCPAFLNAWNFLDDLAGLHAGADTPHTRLSRAAAVCYDRLFRGNNLPAVTPPGERFEPSWGENDLAAIRGVMLAGLELLAAELRGAGGPARDGKHN